MKNLHGILSFMKFAGISGLGWLLDITIFLTLVSVFKLELFQANTVSSCTAALVVFLLSREFIFHKTSKVLLLRVAIYLTYTLIVIFVASMVIGIIVSILRPLAENIIDKWMMIVLAGTAKVIVTPPQLILNYYMSRFISERQI